VVDPVLGDSSCVYVYKLGSWGPLEANRLVADVGGWNNPVEKFKRQ
jgi:glucose-6-phosphate 1-dehydrogenase